MATRGRGTGPEFMAESEVSDAALSMIELGEVAAPEAIDSRNLPDRLRRGLLALIVVLSGLLGTAGSAPRVPGLGEPLWTGAASWEEVTLGSQILFIRESDGTGIVGRDARTGELRWRLGIEARGRVFIEDLGVGIVAVYSQREPITVAQELTLTIVADATGAVLATPTGFTIGWIHSGQKLLVFSQREAGTDDCPVGEELCTDAFAVDVGLEGAETWRMRLPNGAQVLASSVDGDIASFATVSREGEVRQYAADTGAVTGTMDLSGADPVVQGLVLDDAFVVVRRGEHHVEMTAYRKATPIRLWTVTVPARLRPTDDTGSSWANDCGQLLCLAADGTVLLVDRSTGQIRAELGDDVFPAMINGVLLATETPGTTGPWGVRLLDQADGRTVASYPRSAIMPWFDADGRALLTQQGKDRTAFIVHGGARVLGSVTGTDLHCQARGTLLACVDLTGLLRVWHLSA